MPIVRVTLDFAMVGQIFQNVLHFENTDGLLTLSQIADDIQANWITPLRTVTDDNGSWVKITVKDMANPTFSPFIKPIAVPGSADFGNGSVPFAGIVLLIGTGLAGRRGRGRIFHPASATNSWLNNGIVTAAAQTTWNAEGVLGVIRNNYVLTGGGFSSLHLEVYHRDDNTSTPCNSLVVRNTFGCQRRRNIGVGI